MAIPPIPPVPIVTKNSLFANGVKTVMKENTPDSYRYVVLVGDRIIESGAGGFSRHSVDAPELAARVDDRLNICSMAKPITGISVLAALQRKNLTPDDLVAPFFPPDWALSDDVRKLTFRDFLSHRTGFLFDPAQNTFQDGTSFADMRKVVGQKPFNPIKQGYSYRNINFAIFRIVLPFLDSYNRFSRKVEFLMPNGADPAVVVAERYRDIVNQTVLAPSGVAGAGMRSEAIAQPGGNPFKLFAALSYPFHDMTVKGIDIGDQTLDSGSQGWCLSVVEIAKVLQTALMTEVILSERSRSYLLAGSEGQNHGLGLNMDKSINGSHVFSHGAWIPFTNPPKAGDAQLAGWCMYFEAQQMIVVVLCNTGHDPVQQTKSNWDARVLAEYTKAYAPGSPGI